MIKCEPKRLTQKDSHQKNMSKEFETTKKGLDLVTSIDLTSWASQRWIHN